MRAALALALILAAPRVPNRTCDVQSRRSMRGGVACAPAAATCASTPAACTSGVENVLKYSEVFSTVGSSSNWTGSQSGGGPNITVVTDNYAIGPDCVTQNAARFQILAQDASSYSLRTQVLAANQISCGFYVKGNLGTSGKIHIWVTSSGLNACVECSYTGDAWTRCKQENTIIGVGNLYIGSDPADCGGTPTAAVDVLVADAQCNTGATLSGYIKTTTAAATCP